MSTNPATRRRVAPDDVTQHNALLRWKNQPQPDSSLPGDATYPPETSAPTDQRLEMDDESVGPSFLGELGEDILRLLRKGESVDQISVLLQISKTLVKRWQRQLASPDVEKMDGRRLYNDAFKEVAIQQLYQGVSVRQLSVKLGVSQVTLHKWKNQALRESLQDPTSPFPATESREDAPGGLNPLTGNTRTLQEELANLREERDTLKKALVILLRSS